ncbi:Glycosyltransferase involved in cell wall bisynthesis [Virgibacillus subterraneus]|uniref:Glycosyltransferase involved in cell wall bisynthesis n=1 Tax=Virgibacillus subterraneus TaxID=621109 RepID=A0A1H9AHJ6_9BACI|nr:glycosyltransferase family 4 protein [Virgibacillus subterraneus]SEP76139.1 Glycosyltransferase involved in cell wall bisynthesis [Virgibacillus subterraneus]
MKVLHINSYFSGSSFYKNLYDEQIKSGLDIDVFVPVPSSHESSDFRLGDYTTISANHGKYDRVLFHLKHNKIYKNIIQHYDIQNYSIIHAHSLFSNGYIAMKLKQDFGIPFVVAVRNTDVNTFFKYMVYLRKLGVQILKESDKIIFLSEPYRKKVIEKYVPVNLKTEIMNKAVVIPNGIDDFWFENKGKPKECPKQKSLRLIYVGVINKNKNLTITINAIDTLQKNGWNVEFTIVGSIGDRLVYQQIKKLSYVNYVSPKTKKELIDIYRANDIFVMPSKTETFGLVYAEAMSQGLPVIYSKGQGFDRQFEDGEVGFAVTSTSYEEISARILDIMYSYNSISGNCIRRIDKFSWSNIENKYREVYEEKKI